MTRAALKYDSLSGSMTVLRADHLPNGKVEMDIRVVPIDALRRIGDADISTLIVEAMTFPGREIKMPLFRGGQHRSGGMRL
jgi:hypothetical protein